jgi:hypothetical protein
MDQIRPIDVTLRREVDPIVAPPRLTPVEREAARERREAARKKRRKAPYAAPEAPAADGRNVDLTA